MVALMSHRLRAPTVSHDSEKALQGMFATLYWAWTQTASREKSGYYEEWLDERTEEAYKIAEVARKKGLDHSLEGGNT